MGSVLTYGCNSRSDFGVSRVSEFYGSSEGNVAFANLFNKDCTIGTTASRISLVEYDVDADEVLRNESGLCIPVTRGNPDFV
ncbi:MAG: hypothetical protein CM1200mP9_08630 [Gammaproteobacteria bacterium]|nr:MAG: hypothetical protein CM1200mP9_08630 [Gammaproteobacteria bacterium]